MIKKDFISLCKQYGANPRAVNDYLKTDGKSRKKATELEILDCMYVYCTDLFYCRNDGNGTVEYLDFEKVRNLVDDASKLREDWARELVNADTLRGGSNE